MSSGLVFSERYDGHDDIARLSRASAGAPGAGKPIDVLRSVTERHAPAGSKFVYASAETAVLGRVLANATQKTVAELTREWLWQPMGAESEAFWRVGIDGQEQTQGGFSASMAATNDDDIERIRVIHLGLTHSAPESLSGRGGTRVNQNGSESIGDAPRLYQFTG